MFTSLAAATPYSELPANWRAPLQREDPVKKGTEAAETQAEQPGDRTDGTRSEIFNVRTSAQVLEELERVPSVAPGDGFSARRAIRKPDPPPDIGRFQTNSQRRRNLPLSKLKRVKPKKRCERVRDVVIFVTFRCQPLHMRPQTSGIQRVSRTLLQ